jgi:hypothetical protein
MQAAMAYIGDPALFALGLPEQVMVMAGPQAIAEQIGKWAAPDSVESIGDTTVRVSGAAAIAEFGSRVTTGANKLDLRNTVCFARVGAKWRVVSFVSAAEAMEQGAAAEGEGGGDGEGEALRPARRGE